MSQSLDQNLLLSVLRLSAWLVLLTVIFVPLEQKMMGCGIPLLGWGWRQALQVGVGIMPQGELALIVALVGLQSAIVKSSTYAIVVLMTAVTTILAPPLLRYLFQEEIKQYAQEKASVAVDVWIGWIGSSKI